MSYRLIDSNELAMRCAKVNDMTENANTRWYKLFGTPELAARTLDEFELDNLNWCHGTNACEKCPYEFDRYGCYLPDEFSLLEWLRGDAE